MKARTIEEWTIQLQTAPKRLRNASGRVKVWTREISTPRTPKAQTSEETANPIYILAAITLGLPALMLIVLVGMNPGVQDGVFATLVTFLVISAVIVAAVFEIKRLADQPSDAERH